MQWKSAACKNKQQTNRNKLDQISTNVADDCYFSDAIQDIKPDSNVLRSVSDRSSHFTHKLVRVNSYLEDVVGKCEEWSERKCSHEDGDEAELENFEAKSNRKGYLTHNSTDCQSISLKKFENMEKHATVITQ